ncbi:MAG: dienelactone hydrolase family protein [Pirellulales bacterium]|nr:dienelactone hydrolase family protein [Pirellulales bacterium]
MSFQPTAQHLLGICCFSLLVAVSQAARADFPLTAFGERGPYGVSMSEVEGQGLLLVPHDGNGKTANGKNAKKQWPGIVFGHGLCGPARSYSQSLERLCSWGFVVIANQEQEDCGVVNIGNPIESMQSAGKFRYCVDSSVMAGNIKKNLHYLASRSDVNPDALALVGHSMGGGVSIDVGVSVNAEQSGFVKAVVGIAPWNGARPVPSSQVSKLNAPLLIFCSNSDKLCPCSGPSTAAENVSVDLPLPLPGFANKIADQMAEAGMPFIFGPGADVYWHGGSAAIYKHARTATLVEVRDANHFAIAGTDGKQLEQLMYHLTKVNGLQFNLSGRPYRWIPTLEYTVAFLYDKLQVDPQKGQAVMAKIASDDRIVKVISK